MDVTSEPHTSGSRGADAIVERSTLKETQSLITAPQCEGREGRECQAQLKEGGQWSKGYSGGKLPLLEQGLTIPTGV